MEVTDDPNKSSFGGILIGVGLWERMGMVVGGGILGTKRRAGHSLEQRCGVERGLQRWERWQHVLWLSEDGKSVSHKKEGRTVGVNFLMVQEWVIMHKWRDWPLLEAQRFHPKEQEGRLRCTCLDVGSRQWELGRSVLLIVSISTKKKKKKVICSKGEWGRRFE